MLKIYRGGVEQGLRFDGVDDTIILSFNPSLKDHTIIIDADFSAYNENKTNRFYESNNMAIYRTKLNKLEFYVKNPATYSSTTKNINKIIIRGDISNVEILTNTDYHLTRLPPSPFINKIILGNDYSNEFGKLKLEKMMVYNRILTDEEIQQLLTA